MATDLAPGRERVYANAGVGGMRAGRWNDVDAADPRLAGWASAGLIAYRDHRGEPAPERLPRACCGAR